MIAIYFIALSIAIFALGTGGVTSSKHFLMMGLSIEVMLLASTLLAVTLFYYSSTSSVLPLLLSLWSVASAETMAFIVLYHYTAKWNSSMDLTKLSKLRH